MTSFKKKIFVSAYACEPKKGSEPGVGWNWILQMSRFFEVWVLTRKNNQLSVEKEAEILGLSKIHFIYYDPPDVFLLLKKTIGVQFFYLIWQIGANKIVKEVMKKNNIDIFHNLTFGNIVFPVSSFGSKKFFIWGPVGGGSVISRDFTKHFSFRGQIKETLRRLSIFILKNSSILSQRLDDADLILCKDIMTKNIINDRYQHKTILFSDVAVDFDVKKSNFKSNDDLIRFISVGVLESFRGFDVLIEAFALAKKNTPNIILEIIGDGYLKNKLQKMVIENKLEESIFLIGSISYEDYLKKINECHVVINSCLKEGGVTLSHDSIAYSKPLICIDTGGYTNYLKEKVIVLPMESRDLLIVKMASEITKLYEDKYRKSFISKISLDNNRYSWNSKGDEFFDLISKVIR